MPNSKQLRGVNLEKLFDEIIAKTEQREAFSEIKEQNIGFSAIEDMKALRDEFIAAETELELWYALVKLSNARRDMHLRVIPIDFGLKSPDPRRCVSAPIHVLPDLSDVREPRFFVASVSRGVSSPRNGDFIVGVNGRSIEDYMTEFTPWIRHSALHGLYWWMALELPKQVSHVPPTLYSSRLNLTLEGPGGNRYDVSLPYNEECYSLGLISSDPGFVEVMERENFIAFVDRDRQLVLLRWRNFDNDYLVSAINDLMAYAEEERLLDYDLIIDVTRSGGGSGSAFAIQRLVDRPFRTTFGNVRLSDMGKARIAREANRRVRSEEPYVFGYDLSRRWRIDWARTDAQDAIDRGDEYTPPVPFKLAHLPKDSDGILQPAPVHFRGQVAIINAGVWGGSNLDQFYGDVCR